MQLKMATRDLTRDGTAVTKRSEVVQKMRIVRGERFIKERALLPFPPTENLYPFFGANGLTPYTTVWGGRGIAPTDR